MGFNGDLLVIYWWFNGDFVVFYVRGDLIMIHVTCAIIWPWFFAALTEMKRFSRKSPYQMDLNIFLPHFSANCTMVADDVYGSIVWLPSQWCKWPNMLLKKPKTAPVFSICGQYRVLHLGQTPRSCQSFRWSLKFLLTDHVLWWHLFHDFIQFAIQWPLNHDKIMLKLNLMTIQFD